MSPDAMSAFKTLRELDPQAGPSDQVFRSRRKGGKGRKTPLSIRGVQNLMARLAGRAGIPGLSPHWMRHTCAEHERKAQRSSALLDDHPGFPGS